MPDSRETLRPRPTKSNRRPIGVNSKTYQRNATARCRTRTRGDREETVDDDRVHERVETPLIVWELADPEHDALDERSRAERDDERVDSRRGRRCRR